MAVRRAVPGGRRGLAVAGVAMLAAAGAVAFVLLGNGVSSRGGAAHGVDPAQVARGRAVSAEDCVVCHATERSGVFRVGPGLWGIVGAPKARIEGFAYSRALAEAGGRWTVDELDAFLTDPHGHTPGTAMIFDGLPDDRARADLIAYLSTLHD